MVLGVVISWYSDIKLNTFGLIYGVVGVLFAAIYQLVHKFYHSILFSTVIEIIAN